MSMSSNVGGTFASATLDRRRDLSESNGQNHDVVSKTCGEFKGFYATPSGGR
jgi:hypothetical protein